MAKITVESSITIAAPREHVFRYVADWRNAPRYVPHIGELRQVGEVGYGLGTQLRGRARFKSLPVESVSEVVEFVENERIVCRSVRGAASANTWLFEGDEHTTFLTSIVSYRFPGRLLGNVVARMLSREVADSVSSSLRNLKRILEGETSEVGGKDGRERGQAGA